MANTCKKIKFDSEAHAVGYIKAWEQTSITGMIDTPQTAYFCPSCFAWHTTSKRKYVKRDIYDQAISKIVALQSEVTALKLIVEKTNDDRIALSQLLTKAQMIEVVDLSDEIGLLKDKYQIVVDKLRKSEASVVTCKENIKGLLKTIDRQKEAIKNMEKENRTI